MSSLKLYINYFSQPARSLILLCKAINVPHEEHHINLFKGEHLQKDFIAVNPFKKVPVIDVDGFIIRESCTGLRYIASRFDKSGQWYPTELQHRAKVDEYLDWQHTNTRMHGMGYFRNKILLPVLQKTPVDVNLVETHKNELSKVETNIVDNFLGSKPFIAGESLTIADLHAACELEQPIAGGYLASEPIKAYLSRVETTIGKDYAKLHEGIRKFSKPYVH